MDFLAPTPGSGSVSEWVIDSFRFGDSYRISKLCDLFNDQYGVAIYQDIVSLLLVIVISKCMKVTFAASVLGNQ